MKKQVFNPWEAKGDIDYDKLVKEFGIERNVIFAGTISYKELSKYYNLADIFIMPSIKDEKGNIDASPVALMEAMMTGLPVVASRFSGNTDFVKKNLCENGINAIAIHGGLSQDKRTRTINLFNNGKVGVLVSTDVAARGLHIENVSHIYNYDLPKDPKDYVHRIGRTARAGESGKVVNLLCEYDHDNFSRVQNEYRTFSIEKTERLYLDRIKTVGMNDRRYSERREHSFRRYR